jgi:hypothetical protein
MAIDEQSGAEREGLCHHRPSERCFPHGRPALFANRVAPLLLPALAALLASCGNAPKPLPPAPTRETPLWVENESAPSPDGEKLDELLDPPAAGSLRVEQGGSTLLKVTQIEAPEYDSSYGTVSLELLDAADGTLLFETKLEGTWHPKGFNPRTGCYTLIGAFQTGAAFLYNDLVYLNEKARSIRPSKYSNPELTRYNDGFFEANAAVASPDGRYVALLVGNDLRILDTTRDDMAFVGQSPAPPPAEEACAYDSEPIVYADPRTHDRLSASFNWAWACVMWEYTDMDPGIISFEGDAVTVSYGEDTYQGRAEARSTRAYPLTGVFTDTVERAGFFEWRASMNWRAATDDVRDKALRELSGGVLVLDNLPKKGGENHRVLCGDFDGDGKTDYAVTVKNRLRCHAPYLPTCARGIALLLTGGKNIILGAGFQVRTRRVEAESERFTIREDISFEDWQQLADWKSVPSRTRARGRYLPAAAVLDQHGDLNLPGLSGDAIVLWWSRDEELYDDEDLPYDPPRYKEEIYPAYVLYLNEREVMFFDI